MEFCFHKDLVHSINKEPAMFGIGAIGSSNEADPYQCMGPHLLRINLRNEPFQVFQEVPLISSRSHSPEIYLRSFNESQPGYVKEFVMFGIRREVIICPIEVVIQR